MRRWVTAFLAVLTTAACQDGTGEDPVERAQFGVFFGGQLQERDEIAFQLDPAKQTQGFRIQLRHPAKRDWPISWELTRPDPKGNSRFVTILGEAHIRRGQSRFEQTLSFAPGDPLGLWNIRVVLDDHVLIDRPFAVYDEAARQRALARDGGI